MATIVSTGGASYSVPAYGDGNWAQGQGNLSSYLIALASTKLDIAGGTFTLTAPVNFGATYGLIAASFTLVSGAPLVAWYSQAFNNQTSVTVTHNLGHYPIVQVLDNSSKSFRTLCCFSVSSTLIHAIQGMNTRNSFV